MRFLKGKYRKGNSFAIHVTFLRVLIQNIFGLEQLLKIIETPDRKEETQAEEKLLMSRS